MLFYSHDEDVSVHACEHFAGDVHKLTQTAPPESMAKDGEQASNERRGIYSDRGFDAESSSRTVGLTTRGWQFSDF